MQDMGGDVAAAGAGTDSAPMDSSPLSRLDSTPRMDSAPLKGDYPPGPSGTSEHEWQSSDSTYAPASGGLPSGGLPTGTTDSGDLQDTWQYPTGGAQDQHPSGGISGDIQSADPTAAAASAAPSVSPMASHASEVMPVTEDTMVGATAGSDDAGGSAGTQEQTYTYVPDTSGATGAGAADAQQEESPMPDVVPIAAEAPPAYPGISPAAAGTPDGATMDAGAGSAYTADASANTDMGAGGGGGTWASSALAQLDEAQQALAGGDWARFGQSMASLRSMLEGAGQGGASAQGDTGAATYTPAGSGTGDGAAAGTGISAASSPAADMSAYTSPASDTGTADTASSGGAGYEWSGSSMDSSPSTGEGHAQQESAIPAVEPAAEAGTLGAAATDSAATYDAGLAGTGTGATHDASYADSTGNGAVAGGDMDTAVGAGVGEGTSADAGADVGAATIAPATGASAGAATMLARLVVISTGAELPLPDQEEITVGREDPSSGIFPDVDLTPYGGEEGGVSRRHARILFIEDEYYVEDLQSTNYTKVDGQRLPAHIRERVEDGARIDFGRVAVIFRRS